DLSTKDVRDRAKQSKFPSPAPLTNTSGITETLTSLTTPAYASSQQGWPLSQAVTARQLLAGASRVSGVLLVNDVLIAEDNKPATEQISMSGLELPRVLGIAVTIGDPMEIDLLRGQTGATAATGTTTSVPGRIVPVPVIPEEC